MIILTFDFGDGLDEYPNKPQRKSLDEYHRCEFWSIVPAN